MRGRRGGAEKEFAETWTGEMDVDVDGGEVRYLGTTYILPHNWVPSAPDAVNQDDYEGRRERNDNDMC